MPSPEPLSFNQPQKTAKIGPLLSYQFGSLPVLSVLCSGLAQLPQESKELRNGLRLKSIPADFRGLMVKTGDLLTADYSVMKAALSL